MRASYAALAIVAGYTSLGHREPQAEAARAIDASATASISLPAPLQINNVNRIAKADMVVAPPRPMMTAGFVDADGLFAPAKDASADVRTAFLMPDAAVAVRTDAFAAVVPAEKPKDAVVTTASISATAARTAVAVAAATTAIVVPKPILRPVVASAAASASTGLLAYAGTEATDAIEKPFAAVMGDKVKNALLDPNIDDAHAWVNNPLPVNARAASEVKCLATAIYFEARGESQEGQIAVAQVVLNRLKNPAYPKTMCDVVYQNKNKRNRCQFSFACDGIPDRINDKSAWDRSMTLARRVLNDSRTLYLADVGASTHYHATYVKPRWARGMKRMDKIGRHVFYKTKNGGWS